MTAFTDIFWPVLDDGSSLETSTQRLSNGADRNTIQAASWEREHTQAVLEEARRAFNDEEARRNSADSKASTYLAVSVGLIPLMTFIAGTIIDSVAQKETSAATIDGQESWRVILSLLFLALSVAYLIQAVRWTFRAMSVRDFHQVGPMDITDHCAAGVDTSAHLAKEILIATRMNRDPINDKVTAIKMAHEFLKRASFSASVTFFVLVIYEIVRRLAAT